MAEARPSLNRKNLSRMPTASSSPFEATQAIDPPTSARARVLAGTETLTKPIRPPAEAAAAPAIKPAPRPRSRTDTDEDEQTSPVRLRPHGATATAAQDALPRWAKGVVICGLLLAVGMPASVLLSRSMLVQSVMAEESNSKAAMVCTSGSGQARESGVLGWLFGGSYFKCGEWETREARQQRERDQYEANYLAKERAKLGITP